MQRPPRIVQLGFEPIDLFAQAVAFLLMPVPLPFQFASQPLGFALAAFEFGDQFVARRGAPARLHALVMRETDPKYKRDRPRQQRSDVERATTR